LETKQIVDALIAFIIFLVMAIIFLVVMFFIIKIAAVLVFGGEGAHYGDSAILATGLIVGASLIGGGALFKFNNK
jgi:hypothetical protein